MSDYNVRVTDDGEEVLKILADKKIDLLILNLMLKKRDGLSVVNKIDPITRPRILIVSAFFNDMLVRALCDINFDCIIPLPVKMSLIMYYINLLTNKSAVQFKHNPLQIKNEISKILNSFAILPNLTGYQFLHYGIWLCFIEENEYINNISEKLYPDIAEKFFTSSERVEIAINNALNRYSKNAPKEIYNKFSLPNNPDASAFIVKAANKLISDNKNYFQ